MSETKKSGFLAKMNLPNRLTLMRILLVPVYLVLLWYSDRISPWWALLVFAAASLTDLFDGRIARKYNLVTNFGKFMDPIADKLLTHTAFILLTSMGRLNPISCIVFVAREFVVSGVRLVAAQQGTVIAAGMSGKVKTVLQMTLAMMLTLGWQAVSGISVLVRIIEVAAVIMTLWSMVEYVWKNRSVFED